MRRLVSFACEGAALTATLDEGAGASGLLVVSGGNEIRIGAHRGMARLAADLAQAGHPVFRFDRRGVGDSEGKNSGFASSAPDIATARDAFNHHCPNVTRIVAFGNCDAATALLLHAVPGIDALVLANPWIIETGDGLPPAAAIRARYASKLRDPGEWQRLLRGAVDFRKIAAGMKKLARFPSEVALRGRIADAMTSITVPVSILLAERDDTAVVFETEWRGRAFEELRRKPNITVEKFDSAAHSFASDADYAVLKSSLLAALAA